MSVVLEILRFELDASSDSGGRVCVCAIIFSNSLTTSSMVGRPLDSPSQHLSASSINFFTDSDGYGPMLRSIRDSTDPSSYARTTCKDRFGSINVSWEKTHCHTHY